MFKKGVVVRAASNEVFPSEEAGEGFRGTGAFEDSSVEAEEREGCRLALLGVGLFSGSTRMFLLSCSGIVSPALPGVDGPEVEAILEPGQEPVAITQFDGLGVRGFRCVTAVEYEFSSKHTCV